MTDLNDIRVVTPENIDQFTIEPDETIVDVLNKDGVIDVVNSILRGSKVQSNKISRFIIVKEREFRLSLAASSKNSYQNINEAPLSIYYAFTEYYRSKGWKIKVNFSSDNHSPCSPVLISHWTFYLPPLDKEPEDELSRHDRWRRHFSDRLRLINRRRSTNDVPSTPTSKKIS